MLINLDNIHTQYINLSSRPERNERLISELERTGLKMERFEAHPWKTLWENADEVRKKRYSYMHNIRKTPGAIGCWQSQYDILQKALELGKHGWVNEDDIVICDDIQKRLPIIFDFLNQRDWDVFWMGGTYHIEPEWHKSINGRHTHRELPQCSCNLNKDWEPTEHPRINKTYGAFSTHSYIVNHDKIKSHLELMDRDMHFSMGIDWFYILHQPQMNCFAFNPGCIRQYSSQSNIGEGVSNQDGFQTLGKHVFSRFMDKYQWN